MSDAPDTPIDVNMDSQPPAPAPAPAAVIKKDPERRTRGGVALGAGIAAFAFVVALAPMAAVTALLWPTPARAPVEPNAAAPRVDFDAIRQSAEKARSIAAVAAAAAAASSPAAAASASTASSPASIAFDPARVGASRALQKKMARARDARREAGATLPELRKPFTVEDLGGAKGLTDIGVSEGARLLIVRGDGKVLAPAGAALPALASGASLASKEKDEDVLEAQATLEGKPVRVLRRCVSGEQICVVDIVDDAAGAASAGAASAGATSAGATSAGATSAGAAGSADAAQAAAAFDEILRREQAKLSPAAATATASTKTAAATTRVPPALAAGAGAIIALALAALLARRALRVGALVSAAAGRLRAFARRPPSAALGTTLPAEVAALESAIDEIFAALDDGAVRSAGDGARRDRLLAVSGAVDAARVRLDARVQVASGDEAALAAVIGSVNALIEDIEARVVRWKSHIDIVAAANANDAAERKDSAGQANASNSGDVEQRAKALAPVPILIVEVAQRLMRMARMPELPSNVITELNALGNALVTRGKTAQALVDQLLLDAATTSAASAAEARTAAALETLRAELASLSPSPSSTTTVSALRGLAPSEIAERMSASKEAQG